MFVYDGAGNRTEWSKDLASDGSMDETTTYVYDANDRLLSETFDAAGTAEDTHTVYSYGPTVQTGKTVHQGLDDTGTVLSQRTMAYDERGRLTQVEIDSDGDGVVDSSIEYAYSDSGIRISMTVDGVKTVYLIDANNPSGHAQTIEEKDDQGNVTKTFVVGQDVIAQAASDALSAAGVNVPAEALLTLLYDGHGSTRALMDAAKNVLQQFAYTAYGTQLGSAALTAAASAFTSLLYSGEHFDAKTQMQYLRARWYDPSLGRFNRMDPFAGVAGEPQSLHKYLYAHASPIIHVDPSGQHIILPLLLLLAAISTLVFLYAMAHNIMAPSAFGGASGFVPVNPSKLQVHLHSIRIQDSRRSADEIFREMTRMSKLNLGPANALDDAGGVGSVIRWDLSPWFQDFGTGYSHKEPEDFRVMVTKYDPQNRFFVVRTLAGHPLAGWRFWGVEELPDGDIVVKTFSVEHPATWVDERKMSWGGIETMYSVWRTMLYDLWAYSGGDLTVGTWETELDGLRPTDINPYYQLVR